MAAVPAARIRLADAPHAYRPDGDYVLYWMIASRRTTWNFGLQRAAEWAADLKQPLLVFEPLRCGYRWASDRLHAFVLQGMADNARRCRAARVAYYPYVEPRDGDGRGLLAALAAGASVVIGDDFPCFFLPRMIAAAARQVPVRLELVDSNGLLPMRAADREFARAHDFRRFLQKQLRPHLEELPEADPLDRRLPPLKELPAEVVRRWPPAGLDQLLGGAAALAHLPIDHGVAPAGTAGGSVAAGRALRRFLDERLTRYAERRNDPEREATSGLSPYLHFGHVGVHQVFAETMQREEWSADRTAARATGSAAGWWGVSPDTQAFLDQLITWRELGFNLCWHRDDYDRYQSLPAWAQRTLDEHTADPRPHLYPLAHLETAETHDPLWNAAQRQLVREGRIPNYLRMLWGKKILEWSATPREALAAMVELNDRYALDGRDPNSYSGIGWILGRYDRPWGPERPIFGKVRYMSSENTARKLRLQDYLRRYS